MAMSSGRKDGRVEGNVEPRQWHEALPAPKTRPSTMKITTGTTSAPTNPIGSRAKILVSTQVSFQNPRRNPGRIVSPGSRGR